jgi:hypothetical protein
MLAQVLRKRARQYLIRRSFSSTSPPTPSNDENINFIKDVHASGLIRRGINAHKRDLED